MTKRLERTRANHRHGETKFWNGPADCNRDYHRTLAHSLINDMSDDDAWDLAIEFGWVGVIAQLGDRARHQIAHEMAQF